MTIESSSLASGALPRLAPDLNFIQDGYFLSQPYRTITGIDGSSGLATALSLTGKFAIFGLTLSSITSTQDLTVKLTVDGEVIWDSVKTQPVGGGTANLFGATLNTHGKSEFFGCNESLLLEVSNGTDNSIDCNYSVRPIL